MQPSLADIEALNAHGPYNDSVWTAEEAFSGRGHYLAKTLREVLTARFTRGELAEMSIADIGCYDGWIPHEVSDLPFRKMVGVEPRLKNIRKGELARKVFGIDTRVEFRVGGLENLEQCLGGEVFDIVVSTGLLHHVESPAEALRAMRPRCGRLLFLETIALDSRKIGDRARAGIEPRDVVYFGRAKTVGMSGNKLESSYYDGSATGLEVVSIPSFETIALSCEPPDSPRRNSRPIRTAIAARSGRAAGRSTPAEPAPVQEDLGAAHGQRYERELAATLIPREHLNPLYRRFCLGASRVQHCGLQPDREARETEGKRINREVGGGGARTGDPSRIRPRSLRQDAVEFGKSLLASGDLNGAETEFLWVTRRWNADWRSVCRSFHYLA